MTGNEISREELSKVIDEWIESGEYRFSNATYYLRKRIDAMPNVQPKEIYNKGYKDGQEALAVHLELCKEETEPSEDCISRQATVERLCKVAEFMNEKRNGLGSPYVMAALFIQDNKDEFPPVTPKSKTGHLILLDECSNSGYYCSECHKKVVKEGWSDTVKRINYCPNCGVKLESEDKE